MTIKASFLRLLPLGLFALLPISSQAEEGEGSWKKLSESDIPSYAKNLARHHLGASVDTEEEEIVLSSVIDDGNLSAEALLVEDPTIGYPLPVGEASVVVQLSEIEILNSLSFTNEDAAGRVSVSTAITRSAAEEGRWQASSFAVYDEEKRTITVDLSGVDAKFVRVSWDSSAAGRIYNFGIFGEPRAEEFAMTKIAGEAHVSNELNPGVSAVDYNLLSHYAGARLAYVSSGNGDVTAMIDGDSATSYTFSSSDKFPAIIIDLGTSYPVTRASALYDQANTKVAFFVLPELSESEDWVGRTSFEEQKLGEHEPLVLGVDHEGTGHLALDFGEAPGRFVIFQFAPTNIEEEGFSVVELGVFSNSVDARYLVSREAWYEDGGKAVEEGGKAVGKAVDEDLESREHLMSYYSEPGYSTPYYGGGGSYGGGGGGGFFGGGGSLFGGGSGGSYDYPYPPYPYLPLPEDLPIPIPIEDEGDEIFPDEEPPLIEVVSRIAVSLTTMTDGPNGAVGYDYIQTWGGPLPEGYTFSVAIPGKRAGGEYHPYLPGPRHPEGIIYPEVLRFYETDLTRGELLENFGPFGNVISPYADRDDTGPAWNP